MNNRLAYLDQAAFLRLCATGQQSVCQSTWVYDGPLDVDSLYRFHRYLGRGLLGRRIERSPLPFGRHRWVSWQQSSDIDVAAWPRPRDHLSSWIDERAQVPVDPQFGPSWHVGVLALDDGGTAISLVASHCVVDGLGLCIAIAEAAKGEARELGYAPPNSRTRTDALRQDAREFVRDSPEILRSLIVTVFLLLRKVFGSSRPARAPTLSPSAQDPDDNIVLPGVTMYVDAASWDARAGDLSGTSNSLFVAFGAKLAERMGRVRAEDGTVTITAPVSERTPDDNRANALNSVTFSVDPTWVTDDLHDIRESVKKSLAALQHRPNELLASLPLIPLVPKWLARKMESLAMGDAELPVGCSNVGALDPAVNRIAGCDADYLCVRMSEQGVTAGSIGRGHGQLFLASGRMKKLIYVHAVAYQPGAENSKEFLRELMLKTLADFRLTGTVDYQ